MILQVFHLVQNTSCHAYAICRGLLQPSGDGGTVSDCPQSPDTGFKFYSNKVVVNKDFETSIPGLRAIGDGASVTRGLQQASANGLSVARSILEKL